MKLILGVVYIFVAIVFVFHFYLGVFSLTLSLLLSVYLVAKGLVLAFFKNNFLSLISSAAGVYFLLLSLSVFPNNFVTVLFLLYLAQKGMSYIVRGLY